MKPFVIASSGTGTGKTLVTSALCHQLRRAGKKVTALKPIISGFEKGEESDSAVLLKSCGLAVTEKKIATISPWRFTAPLSPNMAAEKEGRTINVDEVVAFCRKHANANQQLLIETAGGIMSPLTNHHTMLDWMTALGWPVILVSGSYLGALSHTLTALNVLQNAPLAVAGLVVSESENSLVSLRDTCDALETFVRGGIPVVALPTLTGKNHWETAPPLNRLWE